MDEFRVPSFNNNNNNNLKGDLNRTDMMGRCEHRYILNLATYDWQKKGGEEKPQHHTWREKGRKGGRERERIKSREELEEEKQREEEWKKDKRR